MRKFVGIIGLIIIFWSVIFSAPTYGAEGFRYVFDKNGDVIITAYEGIKSEITIPSTIDGRKVMGVDFYTATNKKMIKNVILEEGIERIENYGFENCINLETIKLPESLKFLGEHTFEKCKKLKSIHLPSQITMIQNSTFQETGLSEFVLSNHIDFVGSSAFAMCPDLKKVVVCKKYILFGKDVFKGCSDDLELYGYVGSGTEKYARENKVRFQTMPIDLITSVTLNESSITLKEGEKKTIIASTTPENMDAKNLVWKSEDIYIARVNDGEVLGEKEGETTITVSNTDGTAKASCKVKVERNESLGYRIWHKLMHMGRWKRRALAEMIVVILMLIAMKIFSEPKYIKVVKRKPRNK